MKQLQKHNPVKICTFLMVLLGCMAFSVRADDLMVLKGTTAKIDVAEGIRKIDIGDPAVITARPSEDGRSVVINGNAEGTSELRIEKLQGADLVTNVVVRTDLNETMIQVQSLLGEVEGLSIKTVGNKIVLEGQILTGADYEKVTKVAGMFSGSVVNLTTFDRSQMNKYVEEAILKDIGIDTVTARVTGDTVVLDGVVYKTEDLKRAEQMAKLRVPNVVDLITVQEVMIETDLEFIDMSVDKNANMGYNVLDTVSATFGGNLTGNGAAQGFPGAGSTNASSIVGGLPITYGVVASATANAQIKADLGNGTAKVVAQPHISTKSGEEGDFQDGFTSYYQQPGQVGGPSSLVSVPYGVILKVKPTLVGQNRIMNQVSLNVSEPISTAVGAVLSLDTFNTASTVLCNVGESMVLSGIVQQQSSYAKNGTPYLRTVPLLDLFFSNKTSDKSRDEFVILVTPQPVFPTSAGGSPFGEQHSHLMSEGQDGKDAKDEVESKDTKE
jgi:Flp pilus assembly secretin CpaC